MSKALSKRISIFLSIDRNTVGSYFNPHDPSSIYMRQLRFDFVQYINESVATYKKFSTIRYKVTYQKEDYELVDPVMHAVRRHFYVKAQQKKIEFQKFKKRSFKLLALSLAMVMFCQGVLPYLFEQEHRVHSALSNALDVFSWVILWKPIEKLIFYWNPFLKDLSLLHKLANAEIILIEAQETTIKRKKMACA